MTDYNKIAKLEQIIRDRYGEDAIVNPRSFWDEQKERQYLRDLERAQARDQVEADEDADRLYVDGFYIPKRLLKDSKRICDVCGKYSFKSDDDVFMIKFGCCELCYIRKIEHTKECEANIKENPPNED